MKIQIASDLHLEFDGGANSNRVDRVERDLLILAGDIATGRRARSFIEEQLECSPVVYVPGNHEYYEEIKRSELDDWWREIADRELHGLYYLQMDGIVIDSMRIKGATWYTDFWGGEGEYARTHINDFQPPYNHPGSWGVPDHKRAHIVATRWLAADRSADVVITHFPPTIQASGAEHIDPRRDSYYFNDQEALVRDLQPKLWISGHTHVPYDYMVGSCRCVGNPCGYPYQKNDAYDPALIIEV